MTDSTKQARNARARRTERVKIFKTCRLCERPNVEHPWGSFACLPCFRDYVAFRREYKREHGRFPTLAEFLADGGS